MTKTYYVRMTLTVDVKVPRNSVNDFMIVLAGYAKDEVRDGIFGIESYSFKSTRTGWWQVTGIVTLKGREASVVRVFKQLKRLLDG